MGFADRMASIEAKLQRASDTLGALEKKVEEFEAAASAAIEIEKGFLTDPRVYLVRARGGMMVPLEFSVLGAEIIHGIRTSLDHMITALLAKVGLDVTTKHQFPICSTEKEFKNAIPRRLDGVPAAAIELIRQQQPFNSKEPKNQFFAIINELDNQDKHRTLLLASHATYIAEQIVVSGAGGAIYDISPPNYLTLNGEFQDLFSITLFEPDPSFTLEFQLQAQMAIEGVGTFGAIPFLDCMRDCFRAVCNGLGGYRQFFS